MRLKNEAVLDGRGVMKLLGIRGPDVSLAMEHLRDFCYLNAPPSEYQGDGWNTYVNRAKDDLTERWKNRRV